jgi:plasmid stabilization system protein ParE
MSSFKIIILEEAIGEITDSILYYNENAPGLGLEFEKEVFQFFKKIEDNPLLFPIKFASIHEAVLNRFPFVITYEVFGNQILILAVFHTHRNPEKKVKKRR